MQEYICSLLRRTMWLAFLGGVLFWAFVCFRVVSNQENHVGYDIRVGWWVFAFFTGFSLLLAFFLKRLYILFFSLFFALSVYGIFVIDKYNYVVQYETWLLRKMPEKGRIGKILSAVVPDSPRRAVSAPAIAQ